MTAVGLCWRYSNDGNPVNDANAQGRWWTSPSAIPVGLVVEIFSAARAVFAFAPSPVRVRRLAYCSNSSHPLMRLPKTSVRWFVVTVMSPCALSTCLMCSCTPSGFEENSRGAGRIRSAVRW